jgi:hypothetical protein
MVRRPADFGMVREGTPRGEIRRRADTRSGDSVLSLSSSCGSRRPGDVSCTSEFGSGASLAAFPTESYRVWRRRLDTDPVDSDDTFRGRWSAIHRIDAIGREA